MVVEIDCTVAEHAYESTVTAPTCTEKGYTTYICDLCGDSYVDNYTDPRPLNILMIGNSFSWDAADFWYDMQTSMTYDAMKSMLAEAYDVHFAVMYKGSATLAYHATCAMNNTAGYTYTEIGPETGYHWTPSGGKNAENNILDQLEARDWDIIVIQSYQHEADGTNPRSTYTGGDNRFTEPKDSLGYLLDYFNRYEPSAQVYYYMPWATTKFYGKDGLESGYGAIADYTQTHIPNMSGTESGKKLAGIIPVGTGIQNARTTYFGALNFNSGTGSTALLKDPQIGLQYDSQHLSFGLGRYIAGLIVAESLIPQQMRRDSYTVPGVKVSPAVGALPEEYTVIAQLAAKNAVKNPFQVTALSGYETDLAQRVCDAIEMSDYSADGISDETALQAYVEAIVAEKLKDMGDAESVVTIHSFTLKDSKIADMEATVTLRIGYTGSTVEITVTDGKAHRFGDWEQISAPNVDGPGLNRRICEICGHVDERVVEGSWQKYALADHLQALPETFCSETNLWDLLESEKVMIDHLGNWVSAGATVYSVTIPVKPGDRIYANSFDQTDSRKGIQVSFISDYGIVKTTFSAETYKEFHANGGYLIAPEGAIAVNIPVWNVNDEANTIHILGYDHVYQAGVTAPTCTERGYTTYTCVCGDSYVDGYVDALGHTEVIDEAVTPGCTENGLTEGKHCSVCTAVLIKQTVVSAKGHDMKKTADEVAPGCETTGKTAVYTCANGCGKTEGGAVIDALGHDMKKTADAVAPGCETTGKTAVYTCANGCGKTEGGVSIDALGHNEVTDPAVAPDCVAEGKTEGKHCDRCGAVLVPQIIIDPNGHTEVTDEAVAATCKATGLTEGKHCSVCEDILVPQTVVDKLPHTEEAVAAVAPDCTTTGLTAGVKCSVCDEVIVAQTVVDALGHTEETIPAVEPGCTTTGLTAGTKCSVCHTTLVAQTVVDKLGHTEETVAGYAATCTTDGLTDGKKCSVCGTVTVEQSVIPATDHAWENGICTKCSVACEHSYGAGGECTICGGSCAHTYETVVKAPNCTDQGYTTYTCTLCGSSYKGNYQDALGHSWQDATCTAPKTCSVCGATEGDPNGHNYTASVTAPNCTDKGYTTHTCSICGDNYKDDYKDALGHTNAAPVEENKVEAGCTDAGKYESVVYCSVCNAEVSREEAVIPAAGHAYTDTVTGPNCVDQGYTTYTCTKCGDSYKSNYIDALGHTNGTPVIEGSEEVVYCAVCGAELSRKPVGGVTYKLGDANGDGEVDNIDAMLIARYDVGLTSADKIKLSVCDVNGDGDVDNIDAMLVSRYDVGYPSIYPIGM